MIATYAANRESMTETYQDVYKLICHIVWKFQRANGGDFEEMKSIANMTFMDAFFSHDESKASFPTWLQIKIRHSLLERMRESCKREKSTVGDKSLEDQFVIYHRPFWELTEELSHDAQTIVELLWELPETLQDTMLEKGTHPRNARAALRLYLKTFFGWTEKHVVETFAEITEVIND